jgi:hypothetical protein
MFSSLRYCTLIGASSRSPAIARARIATRVVPLLVFRHENSTIRCPPKRPLSVLIAFPAATVISTGSSAVKTTRPQRVAPDGTSAQEFGISGAWDPCGVAGMTASVASAVERNARLPLQLSVMDSSTTSNRPSFLLWAGFPVCGFALHEFGLRDAHDALECGLEPTRSLRAFVVLVAVVFGRHSTV